MLGLTKRKRKKKKKGIQVNKYLLATYSFQDTVTHTWLGEEGLTKIKHEAVCNPACTRAPRSAERHEWEICLFCFIQKMHLLRLLEVIKQREIVKAHITDCNIFNLNPYRTSITRDDDGLLIGKGIYKIPAWTSQRKLEGSVWGSDLTWKAEAVRQYHCHETPPPLPHTTLPMTCAPQNKCWEFHGFEYSNSS